jgi:hypothetical protein
MHVCRILSFGGYRFDVREAVWDVFGDASQSCPAYEITNQREKNRSTHHRWAAVDLSVRGIITRLIRSCFLGVCVSPRAWYRSDCSLWFDQRHSNLREETADDAIRDTLGRSKVF